MKRFTCLAAALAAAWAASADADWIDAACDIFPAGSDHHDKLIPCTFSQRQGYITITRDDGVVHELSPLGDGPGNFEDRDGRQVYRESGLGDQGQIFRFPDISIFVYWNTSMLEPADEDNPTWPFTTAEYDATALFRCKAAGATEFGNCPGGIARMEDNQASITVRNPSGEQFTINFMTDYVNATNREVEASLEGDTWILRFANGEVWEVPIAAIEGDETVRALTRACVLGVTIGLSAPGNASASELEGTGWRLLNITSMDDTIDVPDDPSKYTLEFAAENRAAMVADCNRGAGTWSSDSPPQLTFGPIAATRALCLPPSLSEKYLAQFEWVRSFMIKGGHLFLATMADGSIIEFEPLPPVVATVLGDEIRARDVPEMQAIIVTRLFDRYAADNGIEVTESELDAYIDRVRRGIAAGGLTAADDLTPDERLEVEAMRRQMGHAMIRQWKINKSLYESYGGRIIYQQLGPEPLDAYHQYLEEREQAGDFAILNPDMRPAFWRYFTDVSMHDFMKPGGDDEANAFATPPYQ